MIRHFGNYDSVAEKPAEEEPVDEGVTVHNFHVRIFIAASALIIGIAVPVLLLVLLDQIGVVNISFGSSNVSLDTQVEFNLPGCGIVYVNSGNADSNQSSGDTGGDTYLSSSAPSSSSSYTSSPSLSSLSSSSSLSLSSSSTYPVTPLIVSMGQSNNQGNGCCYNSSVDFGYSSMLQYFYGDSYGYGTHNPTDATIAAKWKLTQANEPMDDGGTNRYGIIGNLVALGRHYVDAYSPTALVLLQSAIGSTSIAQWNSDFITRMQVGVTNITLLRPGTTITMFTWIQGEADAGSTTYQTDLVNLIQRVRTTTPGATITTPFVIGSMVPEYATANTNEQTVYNAHRTIPNIVPYTAFRNAPLGLVDYYEAIHYGATGQRLMGELLLHGYQDALLNTATGAIPNHPTGLMVTVTSDGLVHLQWTTPTVSNTAPITNFRVMWKLYTGLLSTVDGDASIPLTITTGSASSTSYVFPRGVLLNNTVYQFDVGSISGNQPSSGFWNSYVVANTTIPPAPLPYTPPMPVFVFPLQTNLTNIVDGFTATLRTGSVNFVTDGLRGHVTQFQAADYYLPYRITSSYTFCTWFSVINSGYASSSFVAFTNDTSYDLSAFTVGVNSDGTLFNKRMRDIGNEYFDATTYLIPSFAFNTQYHACYTYNITTYVANIYLNGALVASGSFSGAPWVGGDLMRVGSAWGQSYMFTGEMQGLVYWNQTITANQIAHLYQHQLTMDSVSSISDYQ